MQTLEKFPDMLEKTMGLPLLLPDKKVNGKAVVVQDRMNQVVEAIRKVAPLPEISTRPMSRVRNREDLRTDIRVWAEQLDEGLMGDQIGRIKLDGDRAICSFYERLQDVGFVNRKVRAVKHVHEVYKPKFRQLPVAIAIPYRGKQVIKALCEAGLKREIRVVTGDLIGESHTVDREWMERTRFGKTVDSIASTSKALARSAQEGVSSVSRGAADIVRTFATDPAIIVGDVVFFMWKV